MNATTLEALKPMAKKYVWWKTPEEALKYPGRVVSQVMKLGQFEDVQRLISHVGVDALRRCLENAEAGDFDERSWEYWHYRLGLAAPGRVPPMPRRIFSA